MPRTLPNHQLIAVAATARCNVPTVRNYMSGQLRRRSTIEAIDLALRSQNLESSITVQPRSLAISRTPKSSA